MISKVILALAISMASALANPDAGFPKSPEVNEDGSVTFRFRASGETAPRVKGSFLPKGELAMTKADRFWEATSPSLDPGIYSYSFAMGGATFTDPHNRRLKRWRVCQSLFEVPARGGDRLQSWQVQSVPHGEVHTITYHSRVLAGGSRELRVYTPPFYNFSEEKYPVLYLLHGSGDDSSGWTDIGRAHVIADNLIAANLARRCLIVMPYGHGNPKGRGTAEEADSASWYAKNDAAVIEDFFKTVKPLIEKRYRVKTEPEHTAVAGLSMGGGQTLRLALAHRDVFGWAGAFSSGGAPQSVLPLIDKAAAGPPHNLLWIACGKDDFLKDWNEKLQAELEESKLPHTFIWSEGAHEWPVWRSYLETFLTKVFK